jgi:hypothetical protein
VLAFNSQGVALGWYVAALSGQTQKAQLQKVPSRLSKTTKSATSKGAIKVI